MYVIGLVVFGLNLNADPFRKFEKLNELLRLSGAVSGHYNGPGEEPLWIGDNHHTIDECEEVLVNESFLKQLAPTPDREEEYKIALAAVFKFLDSMTEQDFTEEGITLEEVSEFRDLLNAYIPQIWILWGSN